VQSSSESSGEVQCFKEWFDGTGCFGEPDVESVFDWRRGSCLSYAEVYGNDQLVTYANQTSQCTDSECTQCADYVDSTGRGPGQWDMDTCYPCSFSSCHFMQVECTGAQYNCHGWSQRDGYYVQEGHGTDSECYPTLDGAKAACIEAGDCGAIATQSNICNGQYRVSHGGPTLILYAQWEYYELRSWELIPTDCDTQRYMTADRIYFFENDGWNSSPNGTFFSGFYQDGEGILSIENTSNPAYLWNDSCVTQTNFPSNSSEWLRCPLGYALGGLYTNINETTGQLEDIAEAKCCYGVLNDCLYFEVSLEDAGSNTCPEDFALRGMNRTQCNELRCISHFECCKVIESKPSAPPTTRPSAKPSTAPRLLPSSDPSLAPTTFEEYGYLICAREYREYANCTGPYVNTMINFTESRCLNLEDVYGPGTLGYLSPMGYCRDNKCENCIRQEESIFGVCNLCDFNEESCSFHILNCQDYFDDLKPSIAPTSPTTSPTVAPTSPTTSPSISPTLYPSSLAENGYLLCGREYFSFPNCTGEYVDTMLNFTSSLCLNLQEVYGPDVIGWISPQGYCRDPDCNDCIRREREFGTCYACDFNANMCSFHQIDCQEVLDEIGNGTNRTIQMRSPINMNYTIPKSMDGYNDYLQGYCLDNNTYNPQRMCKTANLSTCFEECNDRYECEAVEFSYLGDRTQCCVAGRNLDCDKSDGFEGCMGSGGEITQGSGWASAFCYVKEENSCSCVKNDDYGGVCTGADHDSLWCYLQNGLEAANCPGAVKSDTRDYYWSEEPCKGENCTNPSQICGCIEWLPDKVAGNNCVIDGDVVLGQYDCEALGGLWEPYTCHDAENYMLDIGQSSLNALWETTCCVSPNPDATPTLIWNCTEEECYAIFDMMTTTFDIAAETCARYNASLVKIESKEENDFARQVCGERSCWIGLQEAEESEDWFWQDGSKLEYKNWNEAGNEPNNFLGDESVAFMNIVHISYPFAIQGRWYDGSPSDAFQYPLCERKNPFPNSKLNLDESEEPLTLIYVLVGSIIGLCVICVMVYFFCTKENPDMHAFDVLPSVSSRASAPSRSNDIIMPPKNSENYIDTSSTNGTEDEDLNGMRQMITNPSNVSSVQSSVMTTYEFPGVFDVLPSFDANASSDPQTIVSSSSSEMVYVKKTTSSLTPAKRLVDSHSTGSTLLQGNLATYDTNLSPAVSELEGGNISTDYTDLYMKFDHNVSTGSQTSLNSAKALIDEEDVYLELEIDKLIGAGNFGKIYLGEYRECVCAFKLVDHSSLNDFILEGDLFFTVSLHPKICRFYGIYAPSDSVRFLVMEYFERGSVLDAMQSQTFNDYEKLCMCTDIAKSLLHLKKEEVIHADLGLRNFLLDTNCNPLRVALTDFGLSRLHSCKDPVSQMAPRWSSPNFARTRIPDFESDLWACGVVFWEIFTDGTKPYATLTNKEIIKRLRDNKLKPKINSEWPLSDIMEDIFRMKVDIKQVVKRIRTYHRQLKDKPENGETILKDLWG